MTSPDDDYGVQVFDIANTIIHPKYEFPHSYYDIVIYEIPDPGVQFSTYVRPVCLPRYPVSFVDHRMRDLVTLTGWGKPSKKAVDIDGMLRQVPIKIYSSRLVLNL